jgi:hypothetical protein
LKHRTSRGRTPGLNRCLRARRCGAATVDYVLGLGVVLPLLLIAIPASRRIMQLVYEFAATTIAWPFM